MNAYMAFNYFDYQECREQFLRAIHTTLEAKANYLTSIKRTVRRSSPITGLALEIYPWHHYCAFSIRLNSDKDRYNSADRQHFEFASSNEDNIESLNKVARYITEIYMPLLERNATNDARNIAHLIFLAGAEALLDHSVAHQLCSLGIDASVIDKELPENHIFEYMVFDVIDSTYQIKKGEHKVRP
ncbi:MAG: hypothetical protein NVSMB70_04050 [Chamaesiphon sp.]